jgi:hypothetical protein
MKTFKEFLVEGQGAVDPTVMYPEVNYSPETVSTDKPSSTSNVNFDMSDPEMVRHWLKELKNYSYDMDYFGATPAQIEKLLKLLRQQYYLYTSGAQGQMNYMDIIHYMDKFYNNLLQKQPWYQDFKENERLRGKINDGIDKVNTYINPMGNIPIIPNINDFQRSAYP